MATGLGARKDAHRANVSFDHPLRPTMSYDHQEWSEEREEVKRNPVENTENVQQDDAAPLGAVTEDVNAGGSRKGQKRGARAKKESEGVVCTEDAGKRKKEKIPTEQKSFHISTDILRRLTLLYAHNLSQGNTEKVTMSAIVNAALDAYLPKF